VHDHLKIQHTTTHCNPLQYTATHRNTPHRTATKAWECMNDMLTPNTLQRAVTHCNTGGGVQSLHAHSNRPPKAPIRSFFLSLSLSFSLSLLPCLTLCLFCLFLSLSLCPPTPFSSFSSSCFPFHSISLSTHTHTTTHMHTHTRTHMKAHTRIHFRKQLFKCIYACTYTSCSVRTSYMRPLPPPPPTHTHTHVCAGQIIKMPRAKKLEEHILKHFRTLPWCHRYLEASGMCNMTHLCVI